MARADILLRDFNVEMEEAEVRRKLTEKGESEQAIQAALLAARAKNSGDYSEEEDDHSKPPAWFREGVDGVYKFEKHGNEFELYYARPGDKFVTKVYPVQRNIFPASLHVQNIYKPHSCRFAGRRFQ